MLMLEILIELETDRTLHFQAIRIQFWTILFGWRVINIWVAWVAFLSNFRKISHATQCIVHLDDQIWSEFGLEPVLRPFQAIRIQF